MTLFHEFTNSRKRQILLIAGVLAPEAMFFTEESTGNEFQIWAVSYNYPSFIGSFAEINQSCT